MLKFTPGIINSDKLILNIDPEVPQYCKILRFHKIKYFMSSGDIPR